MTYLEVVLAALPVLLVVGHGAPPRPVVSDAGAAHQAPAPRPRHPQRGGGPSAVALEPPSQLVLVSSAPPEHIFAIKCVSHSHSVSPGCGGLVLLKICPVQPLLVLGTVHGTHGANHGGAAAEHVGGELLVFEGP